MFDSFKNNDIRKFQLSLSPICHCHLYYFKLQKSEIRLPFKKEKKKNLAITRADELMLL